MARIRVDNLRKTFGSFEALKSVSLDVRDQEFTVLLGPSGCGRTTLLGIIAGLETGTASDVQVGDPASEGVFSSEVQVVEPLGPNLQLTATVDGQLLRVSAPPDLAVHPGATIALRPHPERLRCFDAESGHALSSS